MNKNKKKKQPVIPQRRKNEELRAVLEKYFPGALQAKNGGYVVNSAALQAAISPENGDAVDEGLELRWVGKKAAYHSAYMPNDKILKPLRADSADFDGTRNILIKGDNLDALKLLRLNYFERVKVIYIDPPYNTASDEFVYNDNYTKSQEAVLNELGYSAEQKEFIKNINGDATHSGWLNFMYPRLLLAKDLLADDGVIFISIDDNEQANLKLICDEIFGENNFIEDFIWVKKNVVQNDALFASTNHDHILCYRKSGGIENFFRLPRSAEMDARFKNPDNDPNGPWQSVALHAKSGKPSGVYTIEFPNGVVWTPPEGTYPKYTKENLLEKYHSGELWFGSSGSNKPRLKKYLSRVKDAVTNSVLTNDIVGSTQAATEAVQKILGRGVFQSPKPTGLIELFALLAAGKDGIIMDFFAGSATTGHAVMELNAKDGGNRQFILVQLPEAIDIKKTKEAHDFVANELGKEPTIFEIAAERLRRAGVKVREEWENTNGNLISGAEPPDVGFRIFEIAEDIGNEMYQRPLAEITHGDIAALPLDSPHDDDTILYNMMLGEAVVLDAPVQEHVKGALYQASDEGEDSYALFVLGEFSVKENYQLLKHARLVCVYDARIKNDKFILELKGNFADKVAVKGKIR